MLAVLMADLHSLETAVPAPAARCRIVYLTGACAPEPAPRRGWGRCKVGGAVGVGAARVARSSIFY